MRNLLICFCRYIIALLFNWQHGSVKTKIVESTFNSKNMDLVQSMGGCSAYVASHMVIPSQTYILSLINGNELIAADDHIIVCVSDGEYYQKKMIDLTAHDIVISKNGASNVKSVVKYRKLPLFDITMPAPHTYYTNDILSHNTITTAIYIVWYVLNNKDRNVMILSQNGEKVKELMDKIKVVIKGLPFYMKPGIITNNVYTMVFDNGCKIVGQTTTGNSGASFTIHLLYIDEFALISSTFLNEFYRTVYPVISSSMISKIIITSTPRGMNKFYEIYVNALNGINTYNPIRVDWFDVPGRDEEWKQETINDLGSEEDFNQEYGNQFTAGSKLLFKSKQLKKMKDSIVKFVNKDLTDLIPNWYGMAENENIKIESHKVEDGIVDTPKIMKFHPKFDISSLSDQRYQFVWTIDIADGDGGDYYVANLMQILPMNKKEIDALPVYGKFSDFFKLVQVGIYRTNEVDIPQNAAFMYHMMSEAFANEYENESYSKRNWNWDKPNKNKSSSERELPLDIALNVMLCIEINKEGKYFINLLETIGGEDNLVDTDRLVVKTLHRMNSVTPKMGLLMNSSTVKFAKKVMKNRVKYNQLMPMEQRTIDEILSMAEDDRGRMISQLGNDDCYDTIRNVSLYMETNYYVEQIEQMIPYLPKDFLDMVYEKLNLYSEDDESAMDDMGDLLDVL